jgi:hypothetical protein
MTVFSPEHALRGWETGVGESASSDADDTRPRFCLPPNARAAARAEVEREAIAALGDPVKVCRCPLSSFNLILSKEGGDAI